MAGTVMPVARLRYVQTRQAQETLHEEFFAALQYWTVLASLVAIGTGLVFVRHWSGRMTGLTTIIVMAVTTNAAVTGILSNVEDRYQARVIWLVPLLAGVLVLERLGYTQSGQRLSIVSRANAASWIALSRKYCLGFIRSISFNSQKHSVR